MAQTVDKAFLDTEPTSAVLGPGLHAAHVELASDRTFHVRALGGQRLLARLADGVERELVEQCLRSGQLVIMAATDGDVLILGALQTQQTFLREPDGTLTIDSKRVEVRALEEVRIKAGASVLKLQEDGRVRVHGHRMLIDATTNVRVLSALVELP